MKINRRNAPVRASLLSHGSNDVNRIPQKNGDDSTSHGLFSNTTIHSSRRPNLVLAETMLMECLQSSIADVEFCSNTAQETSFYSMIQWRKTSESLLATNAERANSDHWCLTLIGVLRMNKPVVTGRRHQYAFVSDRRMRGSTTMWLSGSCSLPLLVSRHFFEPITVDVERPTGREGETRGRTFFS